MKKEKVIKESNLNEIIRININDLTNNEVIFKSDKERDKAKIKIDDNELIRILKTLNPENKKTDKSEFCFVKDLIVLKVGKSNKYKDIKNSNGIIKVDGIEYKRKICSSGHNRSQKAFFVSLELYEKVENILLCGIDRNSNFVPSKFNSYDGLVSTDTKTVSFPNIVVIDDFKKPLNGIFDVVKGSVKDCVYSVENNVQKEIEILPFDGAGLISVNCATKWAKDLKLLNESGTEGYIPSSFQFRCLAGLKGNLYTFDIYEFTKEFEKSKLTDIWGKTWDLHDDKIEVIMTKSQFKFHKLYNDFQHWKDSFMVELHGYKRTFNISEVAENIESLKHSALLSYQPLQTLKLTEKGIIKLCEPTVNKIKSIHDNVDEFLKYRNIDDNNEESWEYIQPYYKALKYNKSLFDDKYIQGKVKNDIKSIVHKSYMGKIKVNGNYQILAPDIFALAQYAFLGKNEVTGLLKNNEIYSNYWNNQFDMFLFEGKKWYVKGVSKVDLLRSPHIACEHCPVKVESNEDMKKWYKYQEVNILTGIHDANLMKLNSADTDGDHVLTISNRTLISAAERQLANPIDFINMDAKEDPKEHCITDIKALIDTDLIGFKNDIGRVINPISMQ